MATTFLGYNRNASTGATTQVLGVGTALVDKDGHTLVLPSGYVVVSARIQHVSGTPAPADGPGANVADSVQIRSGSDVVETATFADLAAYNHLAVIGSGSAAAPTGAKSSNQTLKLHGYDNGTGDSDLADNGALFCAVIKIRPMPTL